MSPKLRYFLPLFVVCLALDQISKQLIIRNFHYGERMVLIPDRFNLTHVRNPGGAFSFFADGPVEIRMFFFIGMALVAVVLLIVFMVRLESSARLSPLALGMILGGALGNLTDRLVRGQVTDFLDLHWHSYHWPAFNVADSFITVGVCVLVLHSFVSSPPDPSA
jgi:signal peptidase II